MSDIAEKFAKLRELYPEDVEKIEAEQECVQLLLEQQAYSQLPATQELVALCRADIVTARVKFASERNLTDDQRDALWHIIDAREWFLKMVAKDYDSELQQIEQQLEADLNV